MTSRPAGKTDSEVKFIVPDGAAEQDGVLEDDGQARPEGLQRQLGDVDVINHNPPCERKKRVEYKCSNKEKTLGI